MYGIPTTQAVELYQTATTQTAAVTVMSGGTLILVVIGPTGSSIGRSIRFDTMREVVLSGTYDNYERLEDYERRAARTDRLIERFLGSLERIRLQQGHRPPPVPIELAALEERRASHRSLVPRRVPWLVSAQSGPRERSSHRRRIRTWERTER